MGFQVRLVNNLEEICGCWYSHASAALVFADRGHSMVDLVEFLISGDCGGLSVKDISFDPLLEIVISWHACSIIFLYNLSSHV